MEEEEEEEEENDEKNTRTSTDSSEVERLLQMGVDCLHENFDGSGKLDLRKAKVEVCLAYFPDLDLSENRKFMGAPGRAAEPRIIGPLLVPQAMLTSRDGKEWRRFLLEL